MRAGIRRFKVHVWLCKRGLGRSVGCTPQCNKAVRRIVAVVAVAATLGRRYGRGFGDFRFTCGSTMGRRYERGDSEI